MKSRYINRFEENISAAENLEPLYTYLCGNAENMDASYLLRSEFVLIVSALDTYVHMLTEDKIVDSFFDTSLDITELEISICKMKSVMTIENENDKRGMFRNIVRNRLKKDSFQSPRSIEYAFGLIGIKKIWTSIKDGMGMSCESITSKLGLIINRRNMIAHESDRNPVTGELQGIDLPMVIDCKNFIVKLVNQLETLL